MHNSLNAFIDRDEAMSGMPTTKNSIEMENHVFQKTKGSKVCLKLLLEKSWAYYDSIYFYFILFYPHIAVKLNYIVNYWKLNYIFCKLNFFLASVILIWILLLIQL